MTSPREQAIEAAETAALTAMCEHGVRSDVLYMLVYGDGRGTIGPGCMKKVLTAAIDAYLAARARLDGAKMMPREATEEMLEAGIDAANSRRPVPDIYRAMHDATPKDGER